jgi:hypothetical protein
MTNETQQTHEEMLEDIRIANNEIERLRKENEILSKDYESNKHRIETNGCVIIDTQIYVAIVEKSIELTYGGNK